MMSDVAMVELDMDRVCRLLLASERSLALVNRRALAATLANVPPAPGQVLPPAPPFAEAVAIAREDGQLIERTRLFLATHPRAIEELTPELTRTLVRIFDPTGRTARLIRTRSPLLSFFIGGAAVIGALTLLVSTSMLVEHVVVTLRHPHTVMHVARAHAADGNAHREHHIAVAEHAAVPAAVRNPPPATRAADSAETTPSAKSRPARTELRLSTLATENKAAHVPVGNPNAPIPIAAVKTVKPVPLASALAAPVNNAPPIVAVVPRSTHPAAPAHGGASTAQSISTPAAKSTAVSIFATTPITADGVPKVGATAQTHAATTLPAPPTTSVPQASTSPAADVTATAAHVPAGREDAARQFTLNHLALVAPGAQVEWVHITRTAAATLTARALVSTGAGMSIVDYTLQDTGNGFTISGSSAGQ